MSILFLNNHNDLLMGSVCLLEYVCISGNQIVHPCSYLLSCIRLCMVLTFYEYLTSERHGILKRNVAQCDVGTVNTLS